MATQIIRKSIEQNRAKWAWEYAKESKPEEGKPETALQKKYKSHVREFPMLVLTCGLVNAVAFAHEKSEGDKGWELISKHLEKWLKTDSGQTVFSLGNQKLLLALLDISPNDAQKMRYLTNETISLFTWLKRFVS
jgi:CRISPR type III-B/RAMP module-associated protein Cmr5